MKLIINKCRNTGVFHLTIHKPLHVKITYKFEPGKKRIETQLCSLPG